MGLIEEHFSMSIGDLSTWFKDYKIEDIELTIEGMTETAGIRRLFINDRGGLKVRLKPKEGDDLLTGDISRRQSNKKIELVFPKLDDKEEKMASV